MLGTLINHCDEALDIDIPEEYFGEKSNRAVFTAIRTANDRGTRGFPFIIHELRNLKKWSDDDSIGCNLPNMTFLSSLQGTSGPLAQVPALTNLLSIAYRQRTIMSVDSIHSEINQRFLTVDELEEAEDKLRKIAYKTSDEGIVKVNPIHDTPEHFIDEALKEYTNIEPIPTCITRVLDDKLGGGFKPGELYIVAGRPSMGKSAFAITILHKIGHKTPIAFFSLEMTGTALIQRLIAMRTRINLLDIIGRRFYSDADKTERVFEATNEIGGWDLYIQDRSYLTVQGMVSHILKLTSKGKPAPKLIIVDYLQLLKPENPKDSREQQIALISRSLKGVAKDLDVPVLAISQLNRALVTEAKNQKPALHHLRESGAIEQDADCVLAIHNSTPQSPDATVHILKNRNGPIGEVGVYWTAELTLFEEK